MNVLLIQYDGKMPNLALMKLSAWHKQQGDDVGFNIADPDKIYISTIFDWNKEQVIGIPKLYECAVEIGGVGVDIHKELPFEIEHIMPDYDLYGIDYSMGYTSRGCPNNCPFCVVPKKEGKIKDNAPIGEFLHPNHDKLILFDNNFLASPSCKNNLQNMIDKNIMVNFNQGLDIRLITLENANMLSNILFFDHKFKSRRLNFAWDLMSLKEETIKRKIDILGDNGIKPYQLMFYVLCGFSTTLKQDMYRVMKLKEWGCDPFVMIYNNRKDNKELRDFARWVNRKEIFKSCTFEEYKMEK